MEKQHFRIVGLHCDGCVAKATKTLQQVTGVSSVAVRLQDGHTDVVGSAQPAALFAAVRAAGFDVAASA